MDRFAHRCAAFDAEMRRLELVGGDEILLDAHRPERDDRHLDPFGSQRIA